MRRVDRIILPPPGVSRLDDKVATVAIQARPIQHHLLLVVLVIQNGLDRVTIRHEPVLVVTKIGTTRWWSSRGPMAIRERQVMIDAAQHRVVRERRRVLRRSRVVQLFGHREETVDVAIIGLGSQAAGDEGKVVVSFMVVASVFGNGLQHLGCGAPARLGGLLQVPVGQLSARLGEEPLAGFLIRLAGIAQSPVLSSLS